MNPTLYFEYFLLIVGNSTIVYTYPVSIKILSFNEVVICVGKNYSNSDCDQHSTLVLSYLITPIPCFCTYILIYLF